MTDNPWEPSSVTAPPNPEPAITREDLEGFSLEELAKLAKSFNLDPWVYNRREVLIRELSRHYPSRHDPRPEATVYESVKKLGLAPLRAIAEDTGLPPEDVRLLLKALVQDGKVRDRRAGTVEMYSV